MSHSTYVGKIASPAAESSWHFPLSAFPTTVSVPRVTVASHLHKGGDSGVCVRTFIDAFLTHNAHLKRAWALARIPTHALSTFDLPSSMQKQSVVDAYTKSWLKCHAALPTWYASSNDAVSDLGICPSWANYLCSLQLHYYQFPPNIHFWILIIAKDWMWTADSLKLNM